MNNKEIFIGIDVSKETLDISIAGKHYKIANSKEALSTFYNKYIMGCKAVLCVLESTGGYESSTMRILQEYSVPVHRVHPNKVHVLAKVKGHFAKTDKLDAILLGYVVTRFEPTLVKPLNKDPPCMILYF